MGLSKNDTFKLGCAFGFFFITLGFTALPFVLKERAARWWKKSMSWFNLFGGGVLLSLAFVHMLADAEEGSPEWYPVGGDDPFALAQYLFGMGYIMMLVIHLGVVALLAKSGQDMTCAHGDHHEAGDHHGDHHRHESDVFEEKDHQKAGHQHETDVYADVYDHNNAETVCLSEASRLSSDHQDLEEAVVDTAGSDCEDCHDRASEAATAKDLNIMKVETLARSESFKLQTVGTQWGALAGLFVHSFLEVRSGPNNAP